MDYRKEVLRTLAHYQEDAAECQLLAALGLAGESGEFVDLIKKQRYHAKVVDRNVLIKELGDIRWYLEVAAFAIGASMVEIEQANVEKLRKRYPDGFNTFAANAKADETSNDL